MFSWIIEKKGKILSIENGTYTVENLYWSELTLGQSIAHDWACMTINGFTSESYSFFVMLESLAKTNFWSKKTWDFFNLERSLKVSDRIDWHFVSGHIDCIGLVKKRELLDDGSLLLGINFPETFSKYTIIKWSIALNGVSLTIAEKSDWYILVSLIPLTQDWTNLWEINLSDCINIEFDLLGKYILNTK